MSGLSASHLPSGSTAEQLIVCKLAIRTGKKSLYRAC